MIQPSANHQLTASVPWFVLADLKWRWIPDWHSLSAYLPCLVLLFRRHLTVLSKRNLPLDSAVHVHIPRVWRVLDSFSRKSRIASCSRETDRQRASRGQPDLDFPNRRTQTRIHSFIFVLHTRGLLFFLLSPAGPVFTSGVSLSLVVILVSSCS